MKQKIYLGRTLCSFVIVLMLMPLGHALMILMEQMLGETALHYSAFAMGFVGMSIVIWGVFSANHTKGTVLGLIGGLLFWTGWVEFLFSYYAWRYGVHCDLIGDGSVQTITRYVGGVGVEHGFTIDGAPLASFDKASLKDLRGSRPEYLIMPATFGMWMMMVMLYTFCTRSGCIFFNYLQKWLHLSRSITLKPMTRIPAMVTFLEINVMMWSCYLLLMFCYDPVFLGSGHWLTLAIGATCLVCSIFMFMRQLRVRPWGANLRMAIATVIIFWTFVEVMARNGALKEVWVDPMNHVPEMGAILAVLVAAIALPVIISLRSNYLASRS